MVTDEQKQATQEGDAVLIAEDVFGHRGGKTGWIDLVADEGVGVMFSDSPHWSEFFEWNELAAIHHAVR